MWTRSADQEQPSTIGGWLDHSTAALLSLSRGDLARTLHEGLSQRVRQHYGSIVCALDQSIDRVTATLTDGTVGQVTSLSGGIHSCRPHWGPFPRAGLNYHVGTEHLYL
jgi:hypothetical protein